MLWITVHVADDHAASTNADTSNNITTSSTSTPPTGTDMGITSSISYTPTRTLDARYHPII